MVHFDWHILGSAERCAVWLSDGSLFFIRFLFKATGSAFESNKEILDWGSSLSNFFLMNYPNFASLTFLSSLIGLIGSLMKPYLIKKKVYMGGREGGKEDV